MMGNYHDPCVIRRTVERFKQETVRKQAVLIERFKSEYHKAKDEVARISAYTAPEDATARRSIFYYYDELLRGLGIIMED